MKVCYYIGLDGWDAFELLLIKGWCSQVSSSEQDLVTRAHRGEITLLSQPASKQQSTADLYPKWLKGKCQKTSELRDCARLPQRKKKKLTAGELSSKFVQSLLKHCMYTKIEMGQRI